MIALFQAQLQEAVGDGVDHRDHFTVGQDEIMINNRRAIRIALSGHAQEVIIGNVGEFYGWTKQFGCNHFLGHA